MASDSDYFKNTKIVWKFQQFNFTPAPGDGSLSATMTFDFSEYGTNLQSFAYGIMGWHMVFNDYVKSYGIEPKVINWNQGDPQVQVQINIDATDLNGNIIAASGDWVKLVLFAYMDTDANDGFYLKNVPNLPNGDTTDAVDTNAHPGTLDAYAFLGGFKYIQGNIPPINHKPTLVSLSATAGVEKDIKSNNLVSLTVNSTAEMLSGDTSNYDDLITKSIPGSVDAGLLALKNGLSVGNDNSQPFLLKIKSLSFTDDLAVDEAGNPVIDMPFDLEGPEYKLAEVITVFQNFQIGRQTGNLYEKKNGSLYVDSWVTGDKKQITFGSYFSLITDNKESNAVWNRGTADILVIALYAELLII